MQTVHGTTVAIDGVGVLLRGPSASGKSDLALRLIDDGAGLVADDRTILSRDGDAVVAAAPPAIAGKIEVRGLGIVRLPTPGATPLRLVVELGRPAGVDRLPEAETMSLMGVDLPLLHLSALEASTPAKIRLALRLAPGEIER